jgi:hypothetical protein
MSAIPTLFSRTARRKAATDRRWAGLKDDNPTRATAHIEGE